MDGRTQARRGETNAARGIDSARWGLYRAGSSGAGEVDQCAHTRECKPDLG